MVKDQLFFRWSKEETQDLINMSGMKRRFNYREVANFLTEKYKTYRTPTACRDKVLKLIKAEKKNTKLKKDNLRAKILELANKGKKPEILKALRSLKAENLSEVDPTNYDKLHHLLLKIC